MTEKLGQMSTVLEDGEAGRADGKAILPHPPAESSKQNDFFDQTLIRGDFFGKGRGGFPFRRMSMSDHQREYIFLLTTLLKEKKHYKYNK